jgi:hypothetical protein
MPSSHKKKKIKKVLTSSQPDKRKSDTHCISDSSTIAEVEIPEQQMEQTDTSVSQIQVHYSDMLSAIQNGLKDTSQLPLGNESTSKPIGALVRAYWDADDVWYDGRVLLYDPAKDMHLLYFEFDGTSEWMDISSGSEDAILLLDELVLHGKYPAKKFTGTDKGLRHVQKNLQGKIPLDLLDCCFIMEQAHSSSIFNTPKTSCQSTRLRNRGL